nr:unnamed protein product [Naegleria fowleri]
MMNKNEGNNNDSSSELKNTSKEEASSPFEYYEILRGNIDNEFKRPKLMLPLAWDKLKPPSEIFEKEINKFGSTVSMYKKGENENLKQISVDFDYLNALSEMPNIEPIKRLTKHYPNASSGSNSEYLFHWMDFREEHNQIPLMNSVMDVDVLRDLNVPLIFSSNKDPSSKLLKLLVEKRKEFVEKSKSHEEPFQNSRIPTLPQGPILQKDEPVQPSIAALTSPTMHQPQKPMMNTVTSFSRIDEQSEGSESEEETKMYIMEDDHLEMGGFDQPMSHETEPIEHVQTPLQQVKMPQIDAHGSERNEESTKSISSLASVQSVSPSTTSTIALSTSSGNTPVTQVVETKKKCKRSKKKKTDETQLKRQASSKPTPNPLDHLGKYSCLTQEDVAFYLKGLKQFKAFQKQTALSNALPPPPPLFFKLKKMIEEEQAIYRKYLFDDAWNNRLVRYFHTDPYIMEQVEKMKQRKKLDRLVPTSATSNFHDMKHILPRHFELMKSMNLFNLQKTKMLVSPTLGGSTMPNVADPILKFSKSIYQTTDKYFTYHRNTLIYQQESAEQIEVDSTASDEASTSTTTAKIVRLPKLPISTNIYKVDDPSLNPIAGDTSSEQVIDQSTASVYDPLKHLHKSKSSMNVYLHRNLPQVTDDTIINDVILPQFPEIDFVCASSAMSALLNTLGPTFSEEWCIPVIAKPYSGRTSNNSLTESSDKTKQKKFTIFLEKPLIKKVWTQRDVNQLYYKYTVKTVSLRGPLIHVPSKTAIPTLKIDEQPAENYTQFELMHRDGEPISYNLFTLGNLKILFRTKIDGAYNDVKTDRATVVKLITKLEYQTEKGLELSTQSELAKWWTNVFLRPASAIIVNRIDVAQNRVCRTEFKRVKDVLPEVEDEEEENERYWSNVLTSNLSLNPGVAGGGANSGFQPQLSIQTVYGVLTELMNLISTFQEHNLLDYRFLIQKMANEPYIHLLVEHRKSSSIDSLIPRSQKFYYDLHMDYEKHGGVNDLSKMDYIPLTWKSKKQIPYTFPIRPSLTTINQEKHKRKNKNHHRNEQVSKKIKQ